MQSKSVAGLAAGVIILASAHVAFAADEKLLVSGRWDNTLLVINRLVRPDLLVEIEAMAIRPRRAGARRATRKPAPRRRR